MMSFNSWLDDQIVTYPYIIILFSDENKWAVQPWKDREEPSGILLSERSQSGVAIWCVIPNTQHYAKDKNTNSLKKISTEVNNLITFQNTAKFLTNG